ncbi:MAG TPA: hypothetical protein VNW04_23770, partial [Puia sp.]|nr:hypothetical protein [Puia sp.]
MIDVFAISDNICSPLGLTTEENWATLKASVSGIREHQETTFADSPFFAALLSKEQYAAIELPGFTSFEQLLIASIRDALKNTGIDPSSRDTLLVITSTKGN